MPSSTAYRDHLLTGRRKKKCDERRPCCRRCELGDFHCLGYGLPGASRAGALSEANETELVHRPSYVPITQLGSHSSILEPLDALIPFSDHQEVARPSVTRVLFQEIANCLSSVPNGIMLDPVVLEDATSLILSQFTKSSQEILFNLPIGSVESGLLWRIGDSEITRWSMYLVARVISDVASGNNGQRYLGWISRFCKQILETPPIQAGPGSMGRLGGLYDLICLAPAVFGTAASYSLFKRCAPVFLESAALESTLWSNDSTISIPEVIRFPRYEMTQFVIDDTIISLSLGTPPLLHYDVASPVPWVDQASGHYRLMYGFPIGMLLLLAKVNVWRASRIMGPVTQIDEDWRDLEEHLNKWNPTIDHIDGPDRNIARFAIQEAWRQAVMIYLHMGMREVNSADPRVEKAVQQIVQLGNIFNTDSPLRAHLLVPCLIAGIAARQETHRAVLRSKLAGDIVPRVTIFPLHVPDLVAVLDHLWHSTGSGGRPVTWDDYVRSRRTVLPVE